MTIYNAPILTQVDIGTNPNDGTGDPIRVAFEKVNNNFANLAILDSLLVDSNGNLNLSAPGNVVLNGVIWPTAGNSISSGMYIGATQYNTLAYLPFYVGSATSDTLTSADLYSQFPTALPGQSVIGPTVVYECVGLGIWRTLGVAPSTLANIAASASSLGNISVQGADAYRLTWGGPYGVSPPMYSGFDNPGEKIVLLDSALFGSSSSSQATDYSIGVEQGNLWFDVDAGGGYKFYSGLTPIVYISPSGQVTALGGIQYADGTVQTTAAVTGLPSIVPYDLSYSMNGTLSAGTILGGHIMDRAVYLPIGLSGSVSKLNINATANLQLDILYNSNTVGSVYFAANTRTGVFNLSSNLTMNVGDTLEMYSNATVFDSNVSSIYVTLKGTASSI
jgi:hypothetical protein